MNGKDRKELGKYQVELEKEYIDKERSLNWLKNGTVGYDGVRILIGAQDQGNDFKKIARILGNDECRFCHTETER